MFLIVGLGNPGKAYANHRHNAGFMAVQAIAHAHHFPPFKKRFQGLVSEGTIGAERVVCLLPQTYMNESGRSVGEAVRFYKIPLEKIIVLHDELDLEIGHARLKTGGGSAGHNGLKSMSAHIGNAYKRIRLGISHPGDRTLVLGHVLGDFSTSEREKMDALFEHISQQAPLLLQETSKTIRL